MMRVHVVMGIMVVSTTAMVMAAMTAMSMGTATTSMVVMVHVVIGGTMVVSMRRDVMIAVMVVMIVAIETIAAVTNVFLVADGQLLTLVAGQLDVLADIRSDLALVASLTQQRVNSLYAVPACSSANMLATTIMHYCQHVVFMQHPCITIKI